MWMQILFIAYLVMLCGWILLTVAGMLVLLVMGRVFPWWQKGKELHMSLSAFMLWIMIPGGLALMALPFVLEAQGVKVLSFGTVAALFPAVMGNIATVLVAYYRGKQQPMPSNMPGDGQVVQTDPKGVNPVNTR